MGRIFANPHRFQLTILFKVINNKNERNEKKRKNALTKNEKKKKTPLV